MVVLNHLNHLLLFIKISLSLPIAKSKSLIMAKTTCYSLHKKLAFTIAVTIIILDTMESK